MKHEHLQHSLASYLAIRAAMGFRMHTTRLLLTDFLDYLTRHNLTGPIQAQVAIDWATSGSASRGAGGQAARLSQVRGFLSFLRASAPDTEIPEQRLLAAPKRPLPYLFTPQEITQLLTAAARMRPQGSLRPILWPTLLGLLASTGLRVGEALRLQSGEVRLQSDPPHLRIVETKFRKARLVPLHPTTAQQLRHYDEQRKRLGYNALSDFFFISEQGKALDPSCVWLAFRRLTHRLNLRSRDGSCKPCLQCLRHTFAVERLRVWYRAGMDVQALIPNLSVYLGHLRPQETYWYLTATPELLTVAAEQFQSYAEKAGGAS